MSMQHIDLRNEPRILDRVNFSLLVYLGGNQKTGHEMANGKATDISKNGIRFYDEWGLPDDALLEIQLQPPEFQQPITQYGRVRWKYPAPDRPGYEIGVQFLDRASLDRTAWHRYVNSRIAKIRAGDTHANHPA